MVWDDIGESGVPETRKFLLLHISENELPEMNIELTLLLVLAIQGKALKMSRGQHSKVYNCLNDDGKPFTVNTDRARYSPS